MESAFCHAVKEEDIPTVSSLLNARANPNISCCHFRNLPCTFTPLQYACIKGNLTLVTKLLRAGAEVNNAEPGWNCNILLLVIHGYGSHKVESHLPQRWGSDREERVITEMTEDGMAEADFRAEAQSRDEQTVEALMQALIESGANVNHLEQDDIARAKFSDRYHLEELGDGYEEAWIYPLIMERHSPLTLACRHRATNIVELLIQAGAHIHFYMDHGITAVEQCFYNSFKIVQLRRFLNSKSQQFLHQSSRLDLQYRGILPRSIDELRKSIAITKLLKAAGASFIKHEELLSDPSAMIGLSPQDAVTITRLDYTIKERKRKYQVLEIDRNGTILLRDSSGKECRFSEKNISSTREMIKDMRSEDAHDLGYRVGFREGVNAKKYKKQASKDIRAKIMRFIPFGKIGKKNELG